MDKKWDCIRMEEEAIDKFISLRGRRGVTIWENLVAAIWEDLKVAVWEDSKDDRLS